MLFCIILRREILFGNLPLLNPIEIYGDEIYFSIKVNVNMVNGKEVVEEGDLGFWPPSSAFCIFYGPTPISRPGEIRPASAV